MALFHNRIIPEKSGGCFTEGSLGQPTLTNDFDAAYRCCMKNAVRLLYLNSETALPVAQTNTANMKTLTTQFPMIIGDIHHCISNFVNI